MKHILYAFLLALAGYIIFYAAIEHRRTRRGPWEVSFARSGTGDPTLVINQPRLGVTNAQVSFAGTGFSAAANGPTVAFRQPEPVPFDLPFGKCVFMDTTFLPGTVTLEMFGHEVQLLPRVLIVDRREHPWRPAPVISLQPPNASPEAAKP